MPSAIVRNSTIQAAGRWDAKYNIALADELKALGLDETPDNARTAMDSIKARDTATKEQARAVRAEAEKLLETARELDQDAELTFPPRNRF